MSWYTSFPHVLKETAKETLGDSAPILGDSNPAHDECMAQYAQAVEMAVRLIESGTLGAGPFSVNVSGHANPGFRDLPGWATDCISINVTRLPEPPSKPGE